MHKYVVLICILTYLISCSSSDNRSMASKDGQAKKVKTSIGKSGDEKTRIQAFSNFLAEVAEHQVIHISQTDLHQKIKTYLPDSIISEGFDLHIHEIGTIDTFRLVFHEYFDFYDDWSNTFLDIFSPSGNLLATKRLQNLSFEGSTNINMLNEEIIEIAYHDFFKTDQLPSDLVILDEDFDATEDPSKMRTQVEGTLYEYYKIMSSGTLKNLSHKNQVSSGRVFPQSTLKLFSQDELKQYNLEEISLMKNEILAEHGCTFTNLETQNYFELQDWYIPKSNQVDNLLTDIEKLNIQRLRKIEAEY